MAFQIEQANINVFSFEEDFQKCAVCFPSYDAALTTDADADGEVDQIVE